MRRTIVVLAFAGVLATAAACAKQSTPTAGPTTAAAASSPSPTADYTADTKKVCDKIDTVLYNGMTPFAKKLGNMIGYKQAKQPDLAAKATAAAQQDLLEKADAVQQFTTAAQDPKMRTAGERSAKSLRATAASDAFFDRIESMDDLTALETEMAGWLMPFALFCEK